MPAAQQRNAARAPADGKDPGVPFGSAQVIPRTPESEGFSSISEGEKRRSEKP
jgi:hypothetical protein